MPDRKIKKKPRVAIVGGGRLGTALAVSLNANGYPIEALISRRLETARKAATLLTRQSAAFVDSKVTTLPAKHIRSLPQADLVLISVPDDQIAKVATNLSSLAFDPPPVALHTSGALSSAVLAPLRAKGWSTGSVHPLFSVSDPLAPI